MGLGRICPPVGQGDLHWETQKLRRQVGISRSGAQVLGAPGWAEAPCNGVLLMKTVAPPGVSGVGRAPGCPGLQLHLPESGAHPAGPYPCPNPPSPWRASSPGKGVQAPRVWTRRPWYWMSPAPEDQLRRSRAPTPASLLLRRVQPEA